MPSFAAADGRAFIARALAAVGLPDDDAAAVAELMIAADLRGADGHGIFRLPQYVRRIRAGGVNVRPKIRTVMEADATALVDGDNGMGHLVMRRAADLAIAKAKTCGIGWVGVRSSNHAGPAALYAMMPLAHDMVGQYLAVANANHMAPWGGIELLLGTNPIATAIPGLEEPPIVMDLATTVVSYGTVKVAALNDETLEDGWMIDRSGKPLTDAKRSAEGSLLPIGGYKGYGLALVFGLLAGTLNGAAMGRDVVDFNADDKTPTNTGQAIMALDIARFGPVLDFKRNVDAVIRDMRCSERLPGVETVRVPGEQSHRKMIERTASGIPIRAALLGNLEKLTVDLGIARLDMK
jgi:L-2-hydroxycarboxylate dehydrogenase (NAD+)